MKSAKDFEAIFGIPEVDSLLSGQLPRGWLGVLSGAPGSGLELVAKQFAQAGADKRTVNYYTTSERTEDLRRALRDFGWRDDIQITNLSDDYYDRVLSHSLEVSRFREKGITVEDIAKFHMSSLEPPPVNFITRLLVDLATLDKPFRLVIDSLDFFLELGDRDAVLSMVRQIRYRAQRVGGYALLTIHPEIHDVKTTGTLEDIADLVLDMEVRREAPVHNHFLTLRKVRNHPERTGSFKIGITDKGLTSAP